MQTEDIAHIRFYMDIPIATITEILCEHGELEELTIVENKGNVNEIFIMGGIEEVDILTDAIVDKLHPAYYEFSFDLYEKKDGGEYTSDN
jgi:hypothetical protein